MVYFYHKGGMFMNYNMVDFLADALLIACIIIFSKRTRFGRWVSNKNKEIRKHNREKYPKYSPPFDDDNE